MVYLLPVERRQRYVQLQEDCSWHGIWFFDRVNHNKTPADIIFFGSSHTINGIMDEVIDTALRKDGVHVVNFGYCRYGMNIYPVMLKEILRSKRPRRLILEVREDENRYSHPVFPCIAGAGDVFLATPFFNRDLIRDYASSFLYRCRLLKAEYLGQDTVVPVKTGNFGFMGSPDTASKTFLSKVLLEHMKPRPALSPLARYFYMTFPRIYLKQLSELCNAYRIQLSFLYIPEYGSPVKEPLEMTTYRKYGDILIPPPEIFKDPDNWFDENHLNRAGAAKLSRWVARRLSSDLENPAHRHASGRPGATL